MHDPRHFTRLANLTVLPSTLSRFSDASVVKAALQRRSFELYGYTGPHRPPPPMPDPYPTDWSEPVLPPDLDKTIAKMRRSRLANPMYSAPRVPSPDTEFPLMGGTNAEDRRWHRAELLEFLLASQIMPKHAPARDLDAEFWKSARGDRRTIPMFVRWVVGHAHFPPPSIVAAEPVPFPLARRVRPDTRERPHQLDHGVWLVNNTPAARALLLSIGQPVTGTVEGANADHAWPNAAYTAGHYAHLAGLVLVPLSFSSLVDAAPLRALIQRHIFERTGYCGPQGQSPPKSEFTPRNWPELVTLSPAQKMRIVARLRHWRLYRPGYFPESAPSSRFAA